MDKFGVHIHSHWSNINCIHGRIVTIPVSIPVSRIKSKKWTAIGGTALNKCVAAIKYIQFMTPGKANKCSIVSGWVGIAFYQPSYSCLAQLLLKLNGHLYFLLGYLFRNRHTDTTNRLYNWFNLIDDSEFVPYWLLPTAHLLYIAPSYIFSFPIIGSCS